MLKWTHGLYKWYCKKLRQSWWRKSNYFENVRIINKRWGGAYSGPQSINHDCKSYSARWHTHFWIFWLKKISKTFILILFPSKGCFVLARFGLPVHSFLFVLAHWTEIFYCLFLFRFSLDKCSIKVCWYVAEVSPSLCWRNWSRWWLWIW